jgi:hypothetical protein
VALALAVEILDAVESNLGPIDLCRSNIALHRLSHSSPDVGGWKLGGWRMELGKGRRKFGLGKSFAALKETSIECNPHFDHRQLLIPISVSF